MGSHNVSKRQLGAWLFAGLSAPVAQFAGGMAWQMVAVLAVVCLGICWLASRTSAVPGKYLSLIEWLWLVYLLASLGQWIGGSWSAGNVYPAVPLILLVLGAAAAGKGTAVAARAGSGVFWLTALIYSIVIAAGIGQVDLKEMAAFDGKTDLPLVAVLLIPALTGFLPDGGRKQPLRAMAGIGAFAVLVSALITGSLSLKVAQSSGVTLLEWVGGLSLAGTLQRFESLVSVALTMGWFSLLAFVFSVGGSLSEWIKQGSYEKGIWIIAVTAGGIMLLKVPVIPEILVFGSVFLWIIAPATISLVGRNKKFQNFKNNA